MHAKRASAWAIIHRSWPQPLVFVVLVLLTSSLAWAGASPTAQRPAVSLLGAEGAVLPAVSCESLRTSGAAHHLHAFTLIEGAPTVVTSAEIVLGECPRALPCDGVCLSAGSLRIAASH